MSAELHAAFTSARAAIEADDAVVLIVREPDLAGQGSIEDAAAACGRFGLIRALVIEGGAKGCTSNLVAVDRNPEPGADLLQTAASAPSLNGEVLNASSSQVGKVVP